MNEFPLYLLVVEGQNQHMTMAEAIAIYNQSKPVDVEGEVVEEDGSIRPITQEEDHQIRWGIIG